MDNVDKVFDNMFDDMYDTIVYGKKSNVSSEKSKVIKISNVRTTKSPTRFSRQKKVVDLHEQSKDKVKKERIITFVPEERNIRASQRKIKEGKSEKTKQRKVTDISKKVKQNLAHQTRYTEPKERSLLNRIILQRRLDKDYYEDIEDDYNFFSLKELEASKNAKKRKDRKLYKKVQDYEDAKEDVTAKKGWSAFKIGLATALLAGCLALVNFTVKETKDVLGSIAPKETVAITLDTIDEDMLKYYESVMKSFKEQVSENDGYEFDFLSEQELLDGYLRIKNKEEKMIENSFKSAFLKLKDQELLDSIVEDAFGSEEYVTFSEKQKRDYRQLAFELLPTTLPDMTTSYIRNPIVCDELVARDDAKNKGYSITLKVNGGEKETVKNIGRLIHLENTLEAVEYRSAASSNNGQTLLEDMLKEAIGDGYENLSKKELRDYMQIAYELLPEDAKNYISDPIELEKTTSDIEIGD